MRVLIVDDHPLFREGLKTLLAGLDADLEAHEAASVEQAIVMGRDHAFDQTFDLVLLDLGLPDCEGLQALERVKPVFEACAVVVISTDENPRLIRDALHLGAAGYVPKTTGFQVTMRALELVLAHGTYLPPGAIRAFAVSPESAEPARQAGSREALPGADVLDRLGDKQLGVLRALMQGKPNKVIARELNIAEGTVKAHLWAVYQVLGVHTRTQAVYRAHELGLLMRAAPMPVDARHGVRLMAMSAAAIPMSAPEMLAPGEVDAPSSGAMRYHWMRSRRGVRHIAFFGSQVLYCTLALRHGVAPVYLVAWLALCVAAGLMALWVRGRVLSGGARASEAAAMPLGQSLGSTLLVLVIGAMMSGPFLTLPPLADLELAVVTLWFYSIVAGVAASAAGWRTVFYAIAATLLPPLAWLWWPVAHGVDGAFHVFVSVGTLVYGVILSRINREVSGLFEQAGAMNVRLQDALRQTEEASRAKTRFLASASHDLRQPLHTLSLYCGALSTHALEPRSASVIRRMDEALLALSKQLDTLLDVSKLDAGIVQPQWARADLAAELERLRQDFEPVAAAKGLALRVSSAAPLWVNTDAVLLDRVLRNLIDNAIKYTADGCVTVQANVDAAGQGDHARLVVADTGLGIPAVEQGRVFDEFYQLNNPERDRSQGFGLGLSIVRRLAVLLNVGLQLQSEPGRGSRFTLTIPMAVPLQPYTAARPRGARGLPAWRGLRVLVLDDELAVRQSMGELLGGLGCEVDLASGSDEACALAARNRPDVALCDLRLRGADDGLQAIRRLRTIHPRLPALLISGDTAAPRLQEAHAAGVPMLHKPVTFDALRAAMAAVVREMEQAA